MEHILKAFSHIQKHPAKSELSANIETALDYIETRKIQEYRLDPSCIEDYLKAANLLTLHLDTHPDDFFAYELRGTAWLLAQDYSNENFSRILEDFSKAIDINPSFELGYFSRAQLLRIDRHYDDALEDFDRAIQLDPYFLKAYQYRAMMKRRMDNYLGAIEDYTRVIELNPSNEYKTLVCRGESKMELRQSESAIEDFTNSIHLDPTFERAFFERGKAWMSLREYDKSIADFNRVLEIDPTNKSVGDLIQISRLSKLRLKRKSMLNKYLNM